MHNVDSERFLHAFALKMGGRVAVESQSWD